MRNKKLWKLFLQIVGGIALGTIINLILNSIFHLLTVRDIFILSAGLIGGAFLGIYNVTKIKKEQNEK